MAVPKVDKKMLEELETMGFPRAKATRALHYSGNTDVENAINWIVDHEHDPDIDEIPLVDVDIEIGSSQSFPITEEMEIKAQKLRKNSSPHSFPITEESQIKGQKLSREQLHKMKEEKEKKLEIEREKERIEAGKKLNEMKRIAEENERQRHIALRKAEKEEEKRARERVMRKLEQDKINRRSTLGLPLEGHQTVKSSATTVQKEQKLQNPRPVYTVTKVELFRECLRSLKLNHQDEQARVRRAFETLLIYVGNVVKNPNQEKYRKIRFSNPLFQDRVGSLIGGVEFLELCGFERTGDFLYLPEEKVDITLLNSAGSVLESAITNPFFGLFSTRTVS
ncbi:UBX domain-containing protein 1-A-like isoform X2 [Neltuma alba]|nr:UBX domain-containing protein 1-A-like isoform X2 [Prosopis alba]XP_028765266.1 UBX domain-containing protein 1-A-like isoform X2 [Prosopis alba]